MNAIPSQRPFDANDTEDLARFAERHGVTDIAPALIRGLLARIPRSPDHVLDLWQDGERALVASVLDVMESTTESALVAVLGHRADLPTAPSVERALDLAEALVRRGPRRRVEVPLQGSFARHAPLLEARGYVRAFAMFRMIRPAAPPPDLAPRDDLRWVEATPDDAAVYHALSSAAFASVPGSYRLGVEGIRAAIASAETRPRLLLAGDRPVGFARVSLDARDSAGVVDAIGRDPSFRGRGLGDHLLAEAIRALVALGAGEIRLEVAATNVRAIELYQRHGFALAAEEPTYRRELVD